jgi:hypothetical protein
MNGIINKFIGASRKGHILGLILLAVAGISIGCTTHAETIKRSEQPAAKKEVATTTQTPSYRMEEDPYFDRQFDGDLDYSVPAPKKSTAIVSKAAFSKIKVGMSLGEVEKILGEEGMLVSTMEVNGRKTQIYKWSNDNFTSYIDVTIENTKVVEKKNKGLK